MHWYLAAQPLTVNAMIVTWFAVVFLASIRKQRRDVLVSTGDVDEA